jgi:hypothetical protein
MSGAAPDQGVLFGHPALRLLIRLKIAGVWRAQKRRLKRPSGWLFALLGLVLFGSWIGSVLLSVLLQRSPHYEIETVRLSTSIAILAFAGMTLIASFSHRGLYLPKEEIELAFSAPIARSDLVRYRMGVNLLRSLLAGLLFGLGAARRTPEPWFGFLGTMLTMLTLPILGQAAALLLGDAENKLGKLAKKLPLRPVAALLGAAVGVTLLALLFVPTQGWRDDLPLEAPFTSLRELVDGSPWLRALLLPVEPWSRMISATSLGDFLPWFLVCAGLWVAGWELTARIRVDFRETSLATSADLAKRLARMRRGGSGLAGSLMTKADLGWKVPWVLGKGTFGAIAWLKLTTIARKARGAFLFSAMILLLVTLGMTFAWGDDSARSVLGGSATLATFGTIYLCSGLRFDFRNDLDQMEQIKAWPARPAVVFLAAVLPQVLVVSALLAIGILLRCAAIGGFHPGVVAILLIQPLVALAWTSVDNAVFLFYPVRFTPGQEGALQHIGRSVLMSFLRIGLAAVAVAVAVVPAVLIGLGARQVFDAGEDLAWTLGALAAFAGLAFLDAGLVLAGGRMLARFDLARDRGA